MNVIERTLEFLERTEIVGAEAEDMALCKSWLRNLAKATRARTQTVPTPAPQVADTIEK